MDRKTELSRYVEETLGEKIEWRPEPKISGLPQHLKMSFQISKGKLLGAECLFLFGERTKELSVLTLEKQIAMIQERTKSPAVLVFDQLPGRTAERLAKRRLSFVVVGRQLFLPFLLVNLRKDPSRIFPLQDTKSLFPASESILVGQLLDGRFESKSGVEVAKILKDSAMTASKAIRELEARGLCRLRSVGRKKLLSFDERSVLWESLRKVLRNPIQTISYCDAKPDIPWSFSGMSALSKQSMLAEDRQQTIAVYRRDVYRSKNVGRLVSTDPENLSYKVEIWNRKPWLFSNEKAIDSISLYLTLRSDADERIQSELEGVMRRIGLSIHGESNG